MKWAIIKKFSVRGKTCFCYADVLAEFPDKDRNHISKVLSSMVNMGMLMKFNRDLYCVIPLSADPETYTPDSRLVAKHIMKGKGYYIAYSSAMYLLGLSGQPGAWTMVATDRQRQPSKKNIKGMEFHFIHHTYNRFFGFQETWVSEQEQAMVSNMEKTIVDAVSKPQLCGGIVGVGKAIYRSKERTDLQKLFYYLARNGSHAAKKRYLFLSDILELEWTSEHDRMLDDSGVSISLLDPAGPVQGRKNSRFGLKINSEVSLSDFLQ